MSNASFDNFMNKFSGEAAAEKEAELRAIARRLMWKRVRRICLLVVLLALGTAGYIFRSEVATQALALQKKYNINLNLGFGNPYAKAEENAKTKVADLRKEAEKHNALVEEAMK